MGLKVWSHICQTLWNYKTNVGIWPITSLLTHLIWPYAQHVQYVQCTCCTWDIVFRPYAIYWNPPYSHGAIVGLSWELIQICLFLVQGVKKGDRVSIYLPMIPELVYTMLACARIGAIHSIVVSRVINHLFIYVNVASDSEKQMSAACYKKSVSLKKQLTVLLLKFMTTAASLLVIFCRVIRCL